MGRKIFTGRIVVYRPHEETAQTADTEPDAPAPSGLLNTSNVSSTLTDEHPYHVLSELAIFTTNATPILSNLLNWFGPRGASPVEPAEPFETFSLQPSQNNRPSRRASNSNSQSMSHNRGTIAASGEFPPLRRRKSAVLEARNIAAVKIAGLLAIIRAKNIKRAKRTFYAASVIQARWRGVLARRRTLGRLSEFRRYLAVRALYIVFKHEFLAIVPSRFRGHVAATRIQVMYRGAAARQELKLRRYDRAVRVIQRCARCMNVRASMKNYKAKMRENIRKEQAATTLAAAARGWFVRMWMRSGGRQALLTRQQEAFAVKQREHRMAVVAEAKDAITKRIEASKRAEEERALLELVLRSANPNQDVINWSSSRLRHDPIQAKRRLIKMPPLATIPAQGVKNESESSVFVPAGQALEPGVQTRLLTEPRNLLASSATRKAVELRAAREAERRLHSKYRGYPDESATMRYALTSEGTSGRRSAPLPAPSRRRD